MWNPEGFATPLRIVPCVIARASEASYNFAKLRFYHRVIARNEMTKQSITLQKVNKNGIF